MPRAMNCSAAISAACHPAKDDFDAAEKPVNWGQAYRGYPRIHHIPGTGCTGNRDQMPSLRFYIKGSR
ncbi:hypothetical protein N7532_010796 [Penicillium argentinense]|uniref:Uncharacterized protein n=1 Tax=Penicillium argentinense TaxID=1131581 RepID=A0A9W9JYD4_9EURO|nr:uncharacterized protein N7532_010796 [Penicillium argentinense]KAJ5086025.1 hypothetical protein N7532_010796 [Penicillium argentinense]